MLADISNWETFNENSIIIWYRENDKRTTKCLCFPNLSALASFLSFKLKDSPRFQFVPEEEILKRIYPEDRRANAIFELFFPQGKTTDLYFEDLYMLDVIAVGRPSEILSGLGLNQIIFPKDQWAMGIFMLNHYMEKKGHSLHPVASFFKDLKAMPEAFILGPDALAHEKLKFKKHYYEFFKAIADWGQSGQNKDFASLLETLNIRKPKDFLLFLSFINWQRHGLDYHDLQCGSWLEQSVNDLTNLVVTSESANLEALNRVIKTWTSPSELTKYLLQMTSISREDVRAFIEHT